MSTQTCADELRPVRPGPACRLLDVVLAVFLLVLLAPLLAVLALGVRLSSPGPALYRQRRVGAGGQEFTLLKLRSMRADTTGPQVTSTDDARITSFGKVLRRTSLDELPQLFNVLRGDMTLVGPRPETPALAAHYPARCRWVFAYRPGMTGPCQLGMRDAAVLPPEVANAEQYYLDVLVPQRVELDATFLRQPTLANTLRMLAATARYLLIPTAAPAQSSPAVHSAR